MKRKIILLILSIFLVSPLVFATYISLTTTVESGVIFNKTTNLQVSLYQGGDEAAYEVSVEPILPEGFSHEGELSKKRVDPQETLNGNFTLTRISDKLPGNYPLVVHVVYHDSNMYPFSIVSPSFLTYKESRTSDVHGTISDLEIASDGSGELILNIRNLDEKSHEVYVKLYLPKELKSDSYEKTVSLDGKEEKEIKYEVSSLGALVGSNYGIFASLEYEDDVHYSSFSRGVIKIVEEKQNPMFIWFLVILFVLLFLVFVYFKVVKK